MVGGVAITSPTVIARAGFDGVGNVSVMLVTVNGTLVLAFVISSIKMLSCPGPTGDTLKLLESPMGVFAVRVPLNDEELSPRVLPIAPAATVLVRVASLFAMTLTVSVQAPPFPIIPPVILRTVLPAAGVNVPFDAPVPLQFTFAVGEDATARPGGKESVNVVNGIVTPLFGFESTIDKVLVSPA